MIKLTLKAVSVKEVFTFLVALDSTLGASHSLPGDAPEQSLALVAVCWRGGRPEDEVVRGGAGYWIYQSLQCLLVDVESLEIK